jgi:hypothetical protein
MINVTITLDEQAAAWARVKAAEGNVSLSRFVGELIHEKMRHSREYEEAMRAALSFPLLKFEGKRLTREELYALPRHLR